MRFPIVIERDEEGYYIVSCPLFKGCYTYGKTLEEAMENIKEVIALCLEEEELAERETEYIGISELEVV